MLVVEIDEEGQNQRLPNYEKERWEDLEKVGYYFIRINPDQPGFNDFEEFGRLNGYITESIQK